MVDQDSEGGMFQADKEVDISFWFSDCGKSLETIINCKNDKVYSGVYPMVLDKKDVFMSRRDTSYKYFYRYDRTDTFLMFEIKVQDYKIQSIFMAKGLPNFYRQGELHLKMEFKEFPNTCIKQKD